MPFSRDYFFKRFKPPELEQLQAAYVETCQRLGRCPITSPQKDEMAREIIQIYECGVSNPQVIADLMMQIESVKPKPFAEQVLVQSFDEQIKIA
ncbi:MULTISPECIES: hypothetical protein [Ochrobactrum]|uniref:Uncharacterized protein n=1 Tax=Ochrobactrum chromiisoli TaxID=2993941 RepID=A0ABT3QMF0_9HYPH|nr:hypothetical protein [Ochrobactrum chromiisoli]MCX2696767.1 hypothetical protein [Ochrobactrum chromiisoli]